MKCRRQFASGELDQWVSDFDNDLLRRLRQLISATVATLCAVTVRFPEMRGAGAEHLTQLRTELSPRLPSESPKQP